MRERKKMTFPFARGKRAVAAPSSAIGQDFMVLLMGEGAPPFERAGENEDIAVVDVCGPLVQHGGLMFPSYDDIRANCLAAFASDARMVVLRIDSPGGDFAGSLELGRTLREYARATRKPLVAFTDSQALSAAYGIACAADEIVITTSAYVGSIGVWAMLADQTAKDKAEGLDIRIVASGVRKADRNPHVAITEAAEAGLQEEVDAMASLFFESVAELRGMPRAKVEALQGAQLFGENAQRMGLADRIVNSFEDLIKGVSRMATYQDERNAYRAKLAKLAASPDEDGKKAAAALKAMTDEDDKEAKKAEAEKEEKKEAKAEGGDKEPDGDEGKAKKAEAEEPKKEEAKAAASAVASAAPQASAESAATVEIARELHALKAQIAKDKEDAERASLLASRPDFDEKVRASLAKVPLAVVREAVKDWPRIANAAEINAAAVTAHGTRGAGEGTGQELVVSETIGQYIDRKLSRSEGSHVGIHREGHDVTLGFMTPEQAREWLDKNAKDAKEVR